jgi:hypothetical protein
MAETVVAQHS